MNRILSLLFVIALIQGCQSNKAITTAQTEIESIRQQFAPDKRVALVNLEPKMQSGALVITGETNVPEAMNSLSERLTQLGLSPNMQVNTLPDPALDGKIYGIAQPSAANLRSKPGHSQELATQAMLGTPLRVWKEENNWYLVQTPDQYLAWLDPGGFVPMTEEEFQDWQSAKKVVYLSDFGFALSEPEADAARVSDLLAGNILLDLGQEQGYAKIGYPDGRIGYVPADAVMPYKEWLDSRNPTAEQIITTAKTMMGRPYLWGGTSGKAMDCSGFTKTAFYLNGLLLPRDASQQVHTGTDIPFDNTLTNLQAGDLLFFGRKATAEQKEKITHVGIYIGDGRMIHSGASNGGIRIESLRPSDSDFAEERFSSLVRAKRVLDKPGDNGVKWLKDVEGYQ